MTSNIKSAILAAIAITVFILFILVNNSQAATPVHKFWSLVIGDEKSAPSEVVYEEEVFEFKDWYGIATYIGGRQIKREIMAFSNTDMSTLIVSVGKKEIVKIEVLPRSEDLEPIEINSLWVDDKPKAITFDYRTARNFVKGYEARITFTDWRRVPYSEKFSLKGFAKAYKWLIAQ